MTAAAENVEAREAERTDPGERGRLRISRTVLRKIAEHAADQDPGSARTRRRIAGVGLGEHGASAQLSGPDDALRVRLDVALRYPAPVRETVASVRKRVGAELRRIADFRVRAIDVTVSALVPADPPARVE
ncbi:Asp23/Gls24 family envelope stress response protein [Saccharopolyspora sp. K220]|uniref:Asp23/Gls24 family envelope stress response protein n=1 Tax=Saccharopolyspora soli TaxID=2926618 RepID=UPI001F594406|nr:Asp23/Gls24 family envelope stress response protein [Saccharopolyspora soli]MCI2419887.1 Asp23/Gls24 family envelope stress response protein [Saccharopolyspora soli]